MKTSYEVVIIGGGIIGNAIAYYLAKEQVDVAVFEENQIGSKATSAAAGMLGAHSEYEGADNAFFPFATYSQSIYSTLKDELYELSGIGLGYKKGGILKLAFSHSDQKKLEVMLAQPTVTWIEAEILRKLERDISPHALGAAYIQDDVSVLPIGVCQAFAKSAQVLGATIFDYTKVLHIKKQNGIFTIETTRGSVEAKHVVMASGVWSTTFFQQLGLPHQITPVKGECISVIDEKAVLKHTIFHEKYYIVPRNDGKLVIGATMKENDWTHQVSLNGIETLIRKAKELLPTVAHMKIDSFWSGLRPQTFDQKPFIGHHPEDESILFATGHYRNGILLAPATGEMIANFILKREVKKEWLEAFRIDRIKPTTV